MKATHKLENTDGRTSQDSERKQVGEGYSRTGEHRGKDKSRQQKKVSRTRSTHFLENSDRGIIFRTAKESERAWGTDVLKYAEGGTNWDNERKGESKGHSRTGGAKRGISKNNKGKRAGESHPLSGDHRGRQK